MLTDEYIQGLRQECNGASYLAFARAVIAAYEKKLLDQKPFTYVYRYHSPFGGCETELSFTRNTSEAIETIPLYLHPAPLPEEQIAEGRCDALQANLEVARHNCEAQERENERLQALCDQLGEALEQIAWLTVSGTKGNNLANAALAAWREMKGQP